MAHSFWPIAMEVSYILDHSLTWGRCSFSELNRPFCFRLVRLSQSVSHPRERPYQSPVHLGDRNYSIFVPWAQLGMRHFPIISTIFGHTSSSDSLWRYCPLLIVSPTTDVDKKPISSNWLMPFYLLPGSVLVLPHLLLYLHLLLQALHIILSFYLYLHNLFLFCRWFLSLLLLPGRSPALWFGGISEREKKTGLYKELVCFQ